MSAETLEKFEFDNLIVLKRRSPSVVLAEEIYDHAFEYPEHEHEHAYFMLTDQCIYRERLGSRAAEHPPNTVLWRPPGIAHADGMPSSNGRAFSVYIKGELLKRFSNYAKIPVDFSENNSYLVFLAQQLRREFRSWSQGSVLIAEGLVLEMLGYAARKETPADKSPPKWLLDIVEKLEDEFLEIHTNTALAKDVGVHPVHLARTFRRYYGRSIGYFIKEKRVNLAMQLILQGDHSLAEISCASGFSDQSQFTRAFKKIAGITPGAFRQEVAVSIRRS